MMMTVYRSKTVGVIVKSLITRQMAEGSALYQTTAIMYTTIDELFDLSLYKNNRK